MNIPQNKPLKSNILQRFFNLFKLQNNPDPLPDLMEDLEMARRDWRHARLYFNNVTDPDLIDYAIFYMGATEKKYVYLLKQAREIGINIDGYQFGMRHYIRN